MKTNPRACRTRGLTFLEAMATAAVLFVGLVALWPMIRPIGCKAPAHRVNCVSNLKQIGLGMRMWANDHGDKFPWQVSISDTGTLEFVDTGSVYFHFLAASNQITSPKVLACNDDKKKSRVSEWDKFGDRNLSYFIGLDADEAKPQSILSGDRNILGGQVSSNRFISFNAQSQASWGTDLHKRAGNIGLADGSAHQVTDNGIARQIQAALLSLTNVTELRFAVPKPN